MAETIHRKTFMQGRMTPEEVHREAYANRCLCGGPAAVRILTMADPDELMRRAGDVYAATVVKWGSRGLSPFVETRWGRMIWIGELHACDLCRASAERAAARGPSWVHVYVEEGPGPERPVVQVPGKPEPEAA